MNQYFDYNYQVLNSSKTIRHIILTPPNAEKFDIQPEELNKALDKLPRQEDVIIKFDSNLKHNTLRAVWDDYKPDWDCLDLKKCKL